MRLLPLLTVLLAAPATPQNLLITELHNDRIMLFDAFDGSPVDLDFIPPDDGTSRYALWSPAAAIQVGEEIWVADPGLDQLVRFDLGGCWIATSTLPSEPGFAPPWPAPRDVYVLGNGRLLWTSPNGVHVLDPTTREVTDVLTGIACLHVSETSALSSGPYLPRAGGVATKPPTVHLQKRVNTGGLNANGPDRIDGIGIDEDPSAPGTYLMVWAEQFGTSELTQDIHASRSLDNGASWTVPVRVDLGEAANLNDSEFPKVAFAADGAAVVVWEDKRGAAPFGSQGEDVYFNRSLDGGATWLPEARPLNLATSGSHVTTDVERIWLDADGNSFYVTWEEALTPGHDRIWFTRSANAGATWSVPVALTAGAGDVDEPKVYGDGGRVHVVYVDDVNGGDDVFYLRSDDGGLTWPAPLSIESDGAGNADAVRLAFDGDRLCAVWLEEVPGLPGGESVHASVSADGGATWGAEVDLSPAVSGLAGTDADWANAVVRGSGVFVAFNHDAAGANHCFVSHSNDGGQSWTLETPLDPGFVGHRPVIVALEGVLAVRYERGPNGANVTAFAFSADDGTTWIPAGEVPNAGPDVDEGSPLDEGPFVVASEVTRSVVVGHFDRPTGSNEVYASVFDVP